MELLALLFVHVLVGRCRASFADRANRFLLGAGRGRKRCGPRLLDEGVFLDAIEEVFGFFPFDGASVFFTFLDFFGVAAAGSFLECRVARSFGIESCRDPGGAVLRAETRQTGKERLRPLGRTVGTGSIARETARERRDRFGR